MASPQDKGTWYIYATCMHTDTTKMVMVIKNITRHFLWYSYRKISILAYVALKISFPISFYKFKIFLVDR